MQHEVPDAIAADGCERCAAQPQACGADRDVRRAAADHGVETDDVLEVGADLLAVQIHVHAADRDEIVSLSHRRLID